MKRLLSTVMILSLLLSQVLIAQAADSAKASTLRLERTTGTVSLTNQSKKTLTCLDGMKLLSGYSLSTNAASYAYVSLDENKAVKLDGLSAATIKQKGKKLELLLSSGKLFFDVKVPLASDETMEIRTSTMVTGIRGTAGVAEVLSPSESTLLLLSGHVQTTSFDPVSHQIRTVQIQAGQRAYFTVHAGSTQPEVRIEPAQMSDIPGFAAVEISKSPSLQTQIQNQTTLDLNTLTLGVAKQLSAEEAAQLELGRLSSTAIINQNNLYTTTPLFSVPVSSDGGHSGSWTPPPPPPPPTPSYTVMLPSPKTAQELQAYLDNPSITRVILSGTGPSTLEKKLTVPATKTLQLENNAILQTSSSTPLTIEGTVSVQQSASLRNIETPNDADPGIIVNSTNSLDIAGTLENSGVIRVGTFNSTNQAITPGKLSISNTGTLNTSGPLRVVAGTLDNNGKLTIPSGGSLKIGDSDFPQISCNVISRGNISIATSATLTSYKDFESYGTLSNSGSIYYYRGLFLAQESNLTHPTTFPNSVAFAYRNPISNTTGFLYGNSLSDILNYAPSNAVVTLLTDMNVRNSDYSLAPNKKLTLSMGDHTLSLQSSQIVNSGDLTLTSTSGTLALSNSQTIPIMNDSQDSAKLTLSNLNITTLETGTVIENKGSGSVTLLGSTKVNAASDKATLLNSGSGTITLSNEATITNASGPALESINGIINLTDTAVLKTSGAGLPAIACSGGTFNMTGGKVSGDTPQAPCYGVSLSKTAKFEMREGSISVTSGSGVSLTDTAELIMLNGTIITNSGNGVLLNGSSNLQMNDGSISASTGNGVLLNGLSKLQLNKGSISAVTGSGVQLSAGTELTMTGGTIQTEDSTGDKFAVLNDSQSTFKFSGGIVRARGQSSVCPLPPDLYQIPQNSTDSWFLLTKI